MWIVMKIDACLRNEKYANDYLSRAQKRFCTQPAAESVELDECIRCLGENLCFACGIMYDDTAVKSAG